MPFPTDVYIIFPIDYIFILPYYYHCKSINHYKGVFHEKTKENQYILPFLQITHRT